MMKWSWAVYLLSSGILWAQTPNPPIKFQFREPHTARYQLNTSAASTAAEHTEWLAATPEGTTNAVLLGSRVVLHVQRPAQLNSLLAGSPLKKAREIASNLFILQAPDALTAARQAERLSKEREVLSAYPVTRREAQLDGPYARTPNDYWYPYQWFFENRNADGSRGGMDLNLRAAWPYSRGQGITIAVADTGLETNHPEFINRVIGAPHFNFDNKQPNGMPPEAAAIHGTAVAGLAVATADNNIGVVGVAPEASLASWVVIGTNQALSSRQFLVDDESLMDMFQYRSNVVQVQNHSWGGNTGLLEPIGSLVDIGISNAVNFGRGGKGSIIVRSGGNGRTTLQNANNSAIRSDPRFIAVGATADTGRAASYSSRGACLLVAAGGGESANYMFTTDRQGPIGYNGIEGALADTNFWAYSYDGVAFKGTSASTPQIAGLAALMLAVNSNLTYRDVQQILVHAARHFDATDPDLKQNGAGFLVSHNVGFGVPDAGQAVRLARNWPTRPALTNIIVTNSNSVSIADSGLRILITGVDVPANIQSAAAQPGTGSHPDQPTSVLPLIDVGLATGPISTNLTNKAALIEHSVSQAFSSEITRAAQAGAAFAIVFFTADTGIPAFMQSTDFVPIPAVLVPRSKGLAMRNYAQSNSAMAQLVANAAAMDFAVSETLLCEHVGVRISLSHPARADLRITLRSPQGTYSVLQPVNNDTNAAPTDWTYWSTQHFYESSAGTWTVSVTDEFPGGTGSVQSAQLLVKGVPITDTDHDGLDDAWETAQFSTLTVGPKEDPDKDGYSNMREQIMGTNPNLAPPTEINFSRWNASLGRASWNANSNYTYEVSSGATLNTFSVITNLAGTFPETEWFTSITNQQKFVRIRALPNP
jgi:subtilisin family serine protease/subtilisin-like proprotein convertase family protein